MRRFATGATRDEDASKPDFRGFLSIPVLRRFAVYMHRHRMQADGKMRDSDNWKRGIPRSAYLSSGWRHWLDFAEHADEGRGQDALEAACAVLFNVMGWMHEEILATRDTKPLPVLPERIRKAAEKLKRRRA